MHAFDHGSFTRVTTLRTAQARPGAHRERRSDVRVRTIYRPCCLITNSRTVMGIVRNFSDSGAMVEIDLELEVGEQVRYFWDSSVCVSARVVWRDGRAHGLQHIETVEEPVGIYPARSVRLPCKVEAICWVEDTVHTVLVENISMGGASLRGLPELPVGRMLTLSLCRMELGSTTVRWTDGTRTGVSFAHKLSQLKLAELLADERFGLAELEYRANDA